MVSRRAPSGGGLGSSGSADDTRLLRPQLRCAQEINGNDTMERWVAPKEEMVNFWDEDDVLISRGCVSGNEWLYASPVWDRHNSLSAKRPT